MTQPAPNGPTLGDLALDELSAQFARTARDLAVLRAQYGQLSAFVEQNAELLGLTKMGTEDKPAESSPEVNGAEVDLPKTGM